MAARVNSIIGMYRDGFRSMVVGRLLWKIILIKLLVLYILARLFFPDYLRTNFDSDTARADHVLAVLGGPQGQR